jgi:hypothetical protein
MNEEATAASMRQWLELALSANPDRAIVSPTSFFNEELKFRGRRVHQ